jgi:hypothetical protein
VRRVLLFIFAVTDTYGQTKREAPRGPLVIIIGIVLLRLGHKTAPKSKVSKLRRLCGKSPVSMATGGTSVKEEGRKSQGSKFQGFVRAWTSRSAALFFETLKP